MNKLIWVVGGVVVVAAIAYFAMRGTKQPENQTADTTPQSQQSLKELLTKGGSQKCEFSDSTAAGSTSGTVYMAGGKMRGDFSAVAQGVTMQGHMIAKDGVVYGWTDGGGPGVKMAFDAARASDAVPGLDVNKSIAYDCEAWSAEETRFAIPDGIVFTDIEAMLRASVGASSSGTAGQCDSCKNAGAYEAQCRAALGC